ncbi:hypothetical protein H0A61_02921 [Koleobacter methoxysyntrophicus]|uniref:Helicase ATP-binding domain-containing protein n=1 Tax=Koleobacter methoxysyntrophicus TaxID=2751313 RepID=A0A8A0RQH9_9FIRM|nr:DEAD/DEAH box helicase family protein [Koleobacter methoxysyntrophicus]QSQ10513.1 hypothetical protein H0A61_02921 [Koleobacter methoxysyntrophicus]
MLKLQDFLADIPFEGLPAAWTSFDLSTFSQNKHLFDYQQEALKFALRGLWKYYEDCCDYRPGESQAAVTERKERFFEWYRHNGLDINLDISVDKQKSNIRNLLTYYYQTQNGCVSYKHFINRMAFWMATGSGKTLIIIKLLELLARLGRIGEIPQHNLLVLAHRDDLLEQLREHVNEFNAKNELCIRLRDLREYPEAKREVASLFRDREVTVFIYRSDNLSDEQKERIVDFRNYDDNGRWFILLDEAHKGDKEDSKRQHIYSILSRNGFLFNFSATFTDKSDIISTAYDFNLARFIEKGYGKHIAIMKQENRAFRDEEDYSEDEKKKVVLKTLLMLAYIHRTLETVQRKVGTSVYHRPLLLVLVNSVNTKDSDLKLFFQQIKDIGKGKFEAQVWEQAKQELRQELTDEPQLMFEKKELKLDLALYDSLEPEDIFKTVYNADNPGDIEVWVRPSNRQEMAFKLKNANRPFALIKIGDISSWLKNKLDGYDILEGFEDDGFFQRLNEDDSYINILMGSRSFYEGWDSNRPNVITFINIGTGTEARKFILQSVGRGVRIEPLTGKRKRLQNLYNAGDEKACNLYPQIKDKVLPLETLFIFGTNRNALYTVIKNLDLESPTTASHLIELEVNHEAVDGHILLVPIYHTADRSLIEQEKEKMGKFKIAAGELELLKQYINYLADERLLVALHNASPRQLRLLGQCMSNQDEYFNTSTDRYYGRVDLAIDRLLQYFHVIPEELKNFKLLEEEIDHFRHIRVFLEDITELYEKITRAKERPNKLVELRRKYDTRELSFNEFIRQIESLPERETFCVNGQSLKIKHVANHYYTPVLMSDSQRINFISHIIRHPSEVRFINDLEEYIRQDRNEFSYFDWWVFSKIDESMDEVYIPYFDPNVNRYRPFYPDFIFWLKKGKDYYIVFADPKGTKHTEFEYKIDGYKRIFENSRGEPCIFSYNGFEVRVYLFLYTEDRNQLPAGYRTYWMDNPRTIAERVRGYTG